MGKAHAVVLGLGVNGLGVVRALGRRGVPTVGVYSEPHEVGRHSRFCKPRRLPAMELDQAAFVEALLALGKELGDRPVLFATSDAQVELLSRERDQLLRVFRYNLPDPDLLAKLMDKYDVLSVARRHGLDTPRTWLLPATMSSSGTRCDIPFPCVVKPRTPWKVPKERLPKITLVRSQVELESFAERFRGEWDNFVVQEVIEGDDSDHAFCCVYVNTAHKVSGVLTGRTIHRYPPGLGWTASCVTADVPELAAAPMRLLEEEQYVGLAELEFKRDRRSGRYLLFEINTRSWAYNSLAPHGGVDLVGMAYRDATGTLPSDECVRQPDASRIWVNLELEAGAMWRGLKDGRWPRLPIRSLFGRAVHAHFAFDDPSPALHVGLGRIAQTRRGG